MECALPTVGGISKVGISPPYCTVPQHAALPAPSARRCALRPLPALPQEGFDPHEAEPYTVFQGLTLHQLKELRGDIDAYRVRLCLGVVGGPPGWAWGDGCGAGAKWGLGGLDLFSLQTCLALGGAFSPVCHARPPGVMPPSSNEHVPHISPLALKLERSPRRASPCCAVLSRVLPCCAALR